MVVWAPRGSRIQLGTDDGSRVAAGNPIASWNSRRPADTTEAMTRSDGPVWERAAEGDAEAFGVLYDRHVDAVYGHALRRCGDWSVAEDVTAMVFLEAWRRRRAVRLIAHSVRPWLLVTANNLLRNTWRSRRRHRRALRRLPGREPVAEQPHDTVVSRLDDRRRLDRLVSLVRQLPAAQRDVVELCVWDGVSYADAAAALGVPVGTVRSRLARARARLAELEHAPIVPEPTEPVEEHPS